jgi:hypothetical protein
MIDEQPTPASPPNRVGLRMRVQIELVYRSGDSENLEFEIVPDKESDFYSGFLSENTPMAQAILSQPVGSVIAYAVGDGKEIRILAIGSGSGGNAAEAAAKRKAAVEEAVRQSNRTNAIIFASSFEGKWGGYDADSINDDWK